MIVEKLYVVEKVVQDGCMANLFCQSKFTSSPLYEFLRVDEENMTACEHRGGIFQGESIFHSLE